MTQQLPNLGEVVRARTQARRDGGNDTGQHHRDAQALGLGFANLTTCVEGEAQSPQDVDVFLGRPVEAKRDEIRSGALREDGLENRGVPARTRFWLGGAARRRGARGAEEHDARASRESSGVPPLDFGSR